MAREIAPQLAMAQLGAGSRERAWFYSPNSWLN
jgi:hypothetical protein